MAMLMHSPRPLRKSNAQHAPVEKAATAMQSIALAFAFLLSFFPIYEADGCLSDGRPVMGTVLEITLCDQHNAASQQAIDALFTTVTRLDAFFSTFSPDSAISALNAHAGQGILVAPPELSELLRLSKRYWRLTQGTFDVTIGPLVTVWTNAGRTQLVPPRTLLANARTRVGSNKINLSLHSHVGLARTGMAIDLGGIAKGYALDRMVQSLKEQGIGNALLDFGQSSIWALGVPPDAPRWRLLVQRPDGQSVGVISLRNQALSISASFGQQFTIQGQQYGHIIDPRTGEPLTRELLACIIAPDATQAEALSKALLILGEKRGIALLERIPGVEGFLSGTNQQLWMTKGWRRATQFVPSSPERADQE